LANQAWENRAVNFIEKDKPLQIVLAAEAAEGWEFVQAWTDPKGKAWLFFRRPKLN
jgi:hypothetical protein